MQRFARLIGLTGGLALAATAGAGTVYNTSVSPGWFVGSGQPNSGFVVSSEGGTELGFNAMYRWYGGQNNNLGPVAGTAGPAVYQFDRGLSPTSGSDPTPVPGLAKWNFRLHGNFGSYDISSASLILDIDWDPSAVTAFQSYDLSLIAASQGAPGSTDLIQASENLGFSYWMQSFDPNALGLYDFRLRLIDGGTQALINSVEVQVQVIPLPPAAWAGLSTLAGVGFVGFIRRRRASMA